jgi:hypothetical protein
MYKFKWTAVCVVLTMVISLLMPVWFAAPARAVGPGDVDTGLLLWLDASDPDNDGNASNNPANNSTVTSWTDKSGRGNNARILSGQGSPSYRTASDMNSMPAMSFTRTNNTSGTVFEVPGVDIRATSRADVTIFSVYRPSNSSNGTYYGVWGQDNGQWDRFFICCGYNGANNGVVGLGVTSAGGQINGAGNASTRLVTTVYNGDTSTANSNNGPTDGSAIYFNGSLVRNFTDNTHVTNAQSTFRIGFDGDDSTFNGTIAEVIIYDRVLTTDEIEDVSVYLSDRYGLTLAPTVTTNAATSINQTSATLNATVNAHNDTTTALTLRYATTSAGVATGTSPTVSPTSVSGATNVSVSANITGLSANTTYFFRVSATNGQGSNNGTILSFTTTSEAVVSSCAGAGAIQNGSFEQTSTVSYISGPSPTGWRTTARATRDSNDNYTGDPPTASAVKANIEITTANVGAAANVSPFAGTRLIEIAADGPGGPTQGVYQDVNTLVGSRVFWSYRHHKRMNSGHATEVSRFRAAPTPVDTSTGNITVPAVDVWTLTEQASPFGASPTLLTDHYDTRTAAGWSNPAGTFEPTTSRTRFLFGNHFPAGTGSANLIDDVRFTTYSACPITVRIVAGRTSNFVIRNVEQDTSTTQVLGSTFRYYAPESATVGTLSGVATGLTASVSNIANTSSTFTLFASEVGTYSANYRISYLFNGTTYTSTSTITVEVVPEVTARFPRVIPFDPTLTTKQLPGIRFATATNVYACFDQSNSGGSALATPTITIGQGALVSNVAQVSTGPPLIDTGTVGGLTAQSSRIRITANSGVLGKGGSKYLRVRASSTDNTDGVAPSCANGISFVIEFKTIKSTQTRRFVVPLKNGRQQG